MAKREGHQQRFSLVSAQWTEIAGTLSSALRSTVYLLRIHLWETLKRPKTVGITSSIDWEDKSLGNFSVELDFSFPKPIVWWEILVRVCIPSSFYPPCPPPPPPPSTLKRTFLHFLQTLFGHVFIRRMEICWIYFSFFFFSFHWFVCWWREWIELVAVVNTRPSVAADLKSASAHVAHRYTLRQYKYTPLFFSLSGSFTLSSSVKDIEEKIWQVMGWRGGEREKILQC